EHAIKSECGVTWLECHPSAGSAVCRDQLTSAQLDTRSSKYGVPKIWWTHAALASGFSRSCCPGSGPDKASRHDEFLSLSATSRQVPYLGTGFNFVIRLTTGCDPGRLRLVRSQMQSSVPQLHELRGLLIASALQRFVSVVLTETVKCPTSKCCC